MNTQDMPTADESGLEEGWVIDQLTEAPVFTQEMAKAKQLAPIGSKITYHTSPRDEDGVTATVIGHHNEWMWIITDSGRFDHITMDVTFSFPDNRSNDEKMSGALWDCIEQNDGDLNESSIDAFRSDLLSLFNITLKD